MEHGRALNRVASNNDLFMCRNCVGLFICRNYVGLFICRSCIGLFLCRSCMLTSSVISLTLF